MKTPLLIEQHFHGAYGVDFNKAGPDDIIGLSYKLRKLGIGGFFPTLVTDSVQNINRQIAIIKEAAKSCPAILGIHLEGIFINPAKKGIHNPEHFLELTVENFQKIEDDFIKIVTLAPELDSGLIEYLKERKVKVQAGHCLSINGRETEAGTTSLIKNNMFPSKQPSTLLKVDGATHTFNAMSGVTHRGTSAALSALIHDEVYAEIIGDGVHVSDDALKLFFKAKPEDKVILISDALPITYSDMKETVFADSKIYYDGDKATSADGTIAGSTKLLPEIIKILGKKGMFKPRFIENTYRYHGLEPIGEIEWDEDFNPRF